ncbi:3-ketoacyl-ACP reductase [Pseudomonas sp. GD03860]|uniref:3-ketoacyl-ACP reductase n=1 Tax=Pseudomonas TaxID=286 RepID=UPI0023639E22|nr:MULTISPECIES: 3-ketoacyl-ACP reductase [Pseudomonas]MDD2058311.1 3-ketoacyl-ACP reductase [Pseudomonas putida]MDH0636244.1 3-ketoacyl-ACP reductase [Pseudomonas sp. GD03860]
MTARPTALVTGARAGIGRAIAVGLAQAGFDLALLDLHADPALQETAELARQLGAKAAVIAGDIAAIDRHDALLDAAEQAIGALTCLVNNAGVSVLSRGDLLEVTPESFDRCQQINSRGTFFLTQAFARRLVKRPAGQVPRSVVTITSSNARAVSVLRGEYCVSKAALSMTSRLFAVRLAEAGIGVYEVQPGLIATEMTAPSKARYDAEIERGLTAIKRWGQPEDVARVVVSMAIGALPYTVGHAVPVDGGLLIPKF